MAFSASPVGADGRLYIASEDGEVYVLEAAEGLTQIARNDMKEVIMATPAISTDRSSSGPSVTSTASDSSRLLKKAGNLNCEVKSENALQLAHTRVRIPIRSEVDSLNLAGRRWNRAVLVCDARPLTRIGQGMLFTTRSRNDFGSS